ncbi:BQ5605_C002g01022 [Microbotryum silenes-dioicae]|uniref:BQ5605_C002g01022 protein n=1 Tax=Microbotryum silenes-dioicae TaxID=796604 RepID=A0A2X0M1F8_9BASI|nr:BQ5605_C002g01022 [Microbotryum silenes-dioicae]
MTNGRHFFIPSQRDTAFPVHMVSDVSSLARFPRSALDKLSGLPSITDSRAALTDVVTPQPGSMAIGCGLPWRIPWQHSFRAGRFDPDINRGDSHKKSFSSYNVTTSHSRASLASAYADSPVSGVSSELFDIASNAARPEAIPLSLFAPGASNKVKMGQTISFATTKDRSATLQPPAWFLTGSSLYFMCGLTTSLDHPLIRLCHEFDSDAFTRSSSGALYHKFSNRQ